MRSADGARDDVTVLGIAGDWTVETVGTVLPTVAGKVAAGRHLVFDGSELGRFDTAGAWALVGLMRQQEEAGGSSELRSFSKPAATLIAEIDPLGREQLPAPVRVNPITWTLEEIGRGAAGIIDDAYLLLATLGEASVSFLDMLLLRRRMRWAALFNNISRASIQAVPIIGLMSFLIGMIIAQQGGFYLSTYGADVLVVDLVGVLTCREIGVLLTAIMIAGRSGAAYTAEIGSMKMREEVDALKVLGLSPVEVLVLPRLLALIIALPILTLVADLAALAGAWVVSLFYIGIPTDVFLDRLKAALTVTYVMIGLAKAPFMAAIIGLIAAIEGMKVKGSAESLGEHTTAAVVKAIFMVVVTDGVFAMIFATIGI
ncbi:phospholipid/cholesterol/gamma-HCH transport system permease protein [Pleomorphomonas diazotrophica]|uniref:ABC transporter permease n=1 Tax=Pleomorphomonas diazotrophica TaxID=1166257 RepID=UPI0008E76011|nr:ABC transporter permease [Pleomorphomonas diazotrophica]SFM48139.1 phospholipid/cholesterol/gamma-HCH transport system permease protein [Pleomorphomonas diazotrophica]